MQPLEFIKYTPRTNCGECGYAACLAFAAAVTKGGEDPVKCPYVDRTRLGDLLSAADRGKDGLAGVAGLLDDKDKALVFYLKSKIRKVDFPKIAAAIGCRWSNFEGDLLEFRYLGCDVTLTHDKVSFDGKDVEEPRDQILLYNYIYFGGGEPLTGEWVGLESLPNSISKVRTLRVYCEERIAVHFCGRVAAFREGAARIDAEFVEELQQGCSAAFQVAVLPHLPMRVLFWDEDREDGFPARVKVLFDRNVLGVLDLESLVFASERMAERLVELSG